MKNKLICLALALAFLLAGLPAEARYKYNPFTGKMDYFEPAILAGGVSGGVSGDIIYFNGGVWTTLAKGANGQFLTLAAGVPSWVAIPGGVVAFTGLNDTPAAYAGAALQLVRVNAATNALEFVAYVTLPNTIANVLSDHNLAAHTALGLFDASGDVDHNLTTNYVANQHIDHTTVSISAAGLITGGGTIAANRTLTLTEATIEAAIDTLANLTSVQGQAISLANSLTVEAGGAAVLNQDLTTDTTPTFTGIDGPAGAALILNNTVVQNVELFAGTAGNPLFRIWGFDGEGLSWLTLEVDNTGASRIDASGFIYFDRATHFIADVGWTWADADDQARITQTSTEGEEDEPLISIEDDRTGATANELSEATWLIDAAGAYALYIVNGAIRFDELFTAAGNIDTPEIYNSAGDFLINDSMSMNGLFGFGAVISKTIAVGVITVTRSYSKIVVEGGTGSGADDLATINGGTEGQIIVIRAATTGANDTVTVKDGTGNIQCAGDFAMDHVQDSMTLVYDGSNWLEVSRSDNA